MAVGELRLGDLRHGAAGFSGPLHSFVGRARINNHHFEIFKPPLHLKFS